MDVFRAQFARVQQQLGALSASQKMLAAALVAVMALTLAMWGRYAGTAEMEAVLEQALNPDEMSRITQELRKQGIEYKVVSDKVLVAADRKIEALANLSYAQVVPQETRNSYDEIVKRISPWDSAASADATRLEAKNVYLGQIIRKFPNVVSADVVIDPSSEVRIGGGGKQPTALVQITTRDGVNPDKKLVRAAAATVAGAQSGLAISRVTVVVNGVHHRVADSDDPAGFTGADDMLTAQQQAEKSFAQKVLEQLSFISGALVTVTVEVDSQSQTKSEEIYDPQKVASKESMTESETTEENNAQPGAGEPGAVTNSPLAVTPPSGAAGVGGSSSTRERTMSKSEIRFSKANIQTATPAGKTRVLRAAVRVPRSYLVQLYRQGRKSTSTEEPDDAALQPLLAAQVKGIRDDVRACTGIPDENDIAVGVYSDVMPTLLAAAVTTKVQGNFTSILAAHYKEVGVGLLALVSLVMLSNMVKKSAPVPAMAAPFELKEAPALVIDDEIAGDVSEGNPTLDGMELDEDAVKAQTMVDQVSTMVKENPDGAAQLVKRWLNRT